MMLWPCRYRVFSYNCCDVENTHSHSIHSTLHSNGTNLSLCAFFFCANATSRQFAILISCSSPSLSDGFFSLLLGIFHLIYALLVGRTLCLSYLAFGIIDNFYLVFSFRCRHRHRRRRLRRCGVLFFPTFSRRCTAETFARSSRYNFHLYILSLADCFVGLFRLRLSYCSTDKYISQRETSEH